MTEKKTFKFVQVEKDRSLKVVETELPQIKDDEILIKVEAASIHPADILFIKGEHSRKLPPPHPVEFEGAGTAVEVGKNHSSRIKVGDRVSFFGAPRSWGQYAVVPGEIVVSLLPNVTFEEAAELFANPATIVMMLKEAQKEGHKAVIHSAGAAALGKMMIRLFKEHGIKTINLVRRDDAKEELTKLGADYVLNMKDSHFDNQLEEVIKKEQTTKFYDAIAGDFTVKILRKMPPKSIISVYGLLSLQPDITVSIWDLFGGKTLNSFVMKAHYNELSPEEKTKIINYIQERLKTTLKSDVIKTFPLEKVDEAIAYSQETASRGKTLFKPWD